MFVHVFYKNDFVKTMKFDKNIRRLVLGREEDCDVSFGFDSLISRHHAGIILDEAGHYLIEDMGSKNGVYIGEKKIAQEKLSFDKRITLGNSSVIVSMSPFKEVKKTIVLDEKIVQKLKKNVGVYEADKALDFLYRVSTKLSSYQNEEAMLDDLFEELTDAYHPDRIILFDIVKKGKDAVIKKLADKKFIEERRFFSRSVVSEVLKEKKAVFLQNVTRDIPDKGKSIRTMGVNSLMAVPLITGKELVGILQLEFLQPNKLFQEQDLYMVCILSRMISGLLKGARIMEAVKHVNRVYKEQIQQKSEIIGEHKTVQNLKALITKVARTNTTVLITGESGTGKELIAKSINVQSKRKDRPFLVINCAAISGNLIESELFGHVKGAFTGADKSRTGKLEAAHEGTVFLDEIGDMDFELQTRLLRFLESGEIQPVGSNVTKFADVRIIAATNRDLAAEVEKGRFRQDLYYRLSVFNLESPPLRKRGRDIMRIAEYYLQEFSRSMAGQMTGISAEAQKILMGYAWPGNIRELKNIIERACVIGDGPEIIPEDLPDNLHNRKGVAEAGFMENSGSLTLADVEKRYILKVLTEQKNNKARTASILGITRKTLYTKLKEYGIHN